MSSTTEDKLWAIFESLPPDRRKAFTARASDFQRAQGFNLNRLIASKESEGGVKCPHCQNINAVKFGVRKGIQWYKCKPCGKTFSGVTNTLLSWTKKDFHVWKKYVKCMMDGRSIRKSAEICRISVPTAFMWRHKILDALTQYVNSQRRMRGVVEMDDTLFPLSFKGGEPEGRKAHKRGTPATKRGTSKEKVCVSCIISRDKKRAYSRVSALGMAKTEDLKRVFDGRISKEAIICSDKGTSFRSYARRRRIDHIQLKSGTASRIDIYHIQNINTYHSHLKSFISRFRGVSTKYLNNYLVWNNVIRHDKRTSIALLKLCIKAVTVTRWREIGCRLAIPV